MGRGWGDQLQASWRFGTDCRVEVGGEVTAGHTDSPPLHGLRLCSAREALIKEGPQQVFENFFLPTVL